MKRLMTCLVIAVGCCLALASDIPLPREAVDVAALVRQLGSEDFREREEATNELLRYPIAPPELLAARNSPDPEVRARAEWLIPSIHRRAEERMLAPGRAFATAGAVDLFVASTASWDLPPPDSRLWLPGYALSRRIFQSAGQEFNWPAPSIGFRGPLQDNDFYDYRRQKYARPARTDGVFEWYEPSPGPSWGKGLVIATGVQSRKSIFDSLIVSRGEIRIGREGDSHGDRVCYRSLVFANGDVTVGTVLFQSVIVSDGNVKAQGIRDCLVIARGDITVSVLARGSVLIAGGKVRLEKEDGDRPHERNYVTEGADNPLGFITFFELSRVGLEVKAADGAVGVVAVAAGKACEKAGLKVGDTILDVNGKKPADAESLRRLLRDALAVGDATVKLQRGNDTLTVKVSLPE